jgi:6-phosphogluconolactonase
LNLQPLTRQTWLERFSLERNGPYSVTIDPVGPYVYVSNSSDDTISRYLATAGLLYSLGTVDTGRVPSAVTVDLSGSYAYVTNSAENTISQYTIGTGGSLKLVGKAVTGTQPVFMTTAY